MSEQELLEQLRAGMDTTPLHTGDLPPLDLYMDQVLAMLEERFQSGARQPGRKPSPRPSSTTIPRPGCCRSRWGRSIPPSICW